MKKKVFFCQSQGRKKSLIPKTMQVKVKTLTYNNTEKKFENLSAGEMEQKIFCYSIFVHVMVKMCTT